MAPVTPVIMRVLRRRCYRYSHAVHGIATTDQFCKRICLYFCYRYSHAVHGIATSLFMVMYGVTHGRYRYSHAVHGIATCNADTRIILLLGCYRYSHAVHGIATPLINGALFVHAFRLQVQSCRSRHCNSNTFTKKFINRFICYRYSHAVHGIATSFNSCKILIIF